MRALFDLPAAHDPSAADRAAPDVLALVSTSLPDASVVQGDRAVGEHLLGGRAPAAR